MLCEMENHLLRCKERSSNAISPKRIVGSLKRNFLFGSGDVNLNH